MVSPEIRTTVEAVKAFPGTPSLQQVSDKLGIHKSTASRRVKLAIKKGYLADAQVVRGRPMRLEAADPLPKDQEVLPTPEELAEAIDRFGASEVPGEAEGNSASPGNDTSRFEVSAYPIGSARDRP